MLLIESALRLFSVVHFQRSKMTVLQRLMLRFLFINAFYMTKTRTT